MKRHSLLLVGLTILLPGKWVMADVANLIPAKDNTLIQQTDPATQLSNGQGDIYVGRTAQDGQGVATISIRRGLVMFDIAGSIPAGATITGVSLTVTDVMGLNGDPIVELHRLLQDWGEGTSFQGGAIGVDATNGDATWLYTFYDSAIPSASPAWTNPGGDFSAAASGSAAVGAGVFSSANDPQLIADVQLWLDNPGSNFGWLLLGDESRGRSAKRLGSGESDTPPTLSITFTPVPEASTLLLTIGGVFFVGIMPRHLRRRNGRQSN